MIYGWHFTNGMKLRDGQELVVGKTYHIDGLIAICDRGYHSSRKILDALRLAPGAQVSRVVSWGDIQEQSDKLVARNRKVIWTLDATRVLHLFTCDVAEDTLKKAGNPDPRSVAAIEVKRRWIDGKATDKELEAARGVAWGVAWEAAWGVAWEAARGVALESYNPLLTKIVIKAHKEAVKK